MAGPGINSIGFKTIGRISFAEKKIWERKNKNIAEYIEGLYGTNAFVKRMRLSEADREIERELYSLEKSGNFHENIIRFLGSESDDQFR
jgi:Adenosine deaminase z-alpha domain